MRTFVACFSLCVACTTPPGRHEPSSSARVASRPPAPAQPATLTRESIAIDSPRTTPRGVAYTGPAGWTSSTRGALQVLTAQEGDAHVAIVDASAREPDAAVTEAWKLYRVEGAPPLKLASDLPPRHGWEQAREYDYELSPNEKRTLYAKALRHGQSWTVVLLDAKDATLGKRLAQFTLLDESIRPAGYERESFAGKTARELDAARLAELDRLIELGRRELGIPGVSLAIVQGGRVVHARGFGVRELGATKPVDADTLFMIGSTTKALSTLLLAQLVDEGKLRWDQPVTDAYPEFRLGSLVTTQSTRVEHLVCACTGLPRKDLVLLFEFAHANPQSELASLASIEPTTGFGETYQYSNLLAAAAGFVAAHTVAPGQELGQAYDAAMQMRIFRPLGMKSTTFAFPRALARNHASPHGWDIDGTTQHTAIETNYFVRPLRPAGGAWSSASELIQYVRLELDKGIAPSGKRLVSEANLLKRRQPYVKIGEHGAYGMGLGLDDTYGTTIVSHGGSVIGFKAKMFWLPEHGAGAVIFSNSDLGAILHDAFERFLLEQIFDGKPEALEDLRSAANTAREAVRTERARLELPAASEAVQALAERYQHPELGTLVVERSAGETRFDLGEWQSAVASRRNDDGTTSFITTLPGLAGLAFVAGTEPPRTLTLREAQHEYVFVEGAH